MVKSGLTWGDRIRGFLEEHEEVKSERNMIDNYDSNKKEMDATLDDKVLLTLSSSY